MWTGFWGLTGLAGTCFFGMLGLPPEYAFLRPWCFGIAIVAGAGSLVCLFWPLRHPKNRARFLYYCNHPLRLARKLEPLHLVWTGVIGAALFGGIAIIGLVWLSFRTSNAAAVTRIDPQMVSIQQTQAAKEAQEKAERRYTSYDIERQLRAIDEIKAVLANDMNDVWVSGGLLNRKVTDSANGGRGISDGCADLLDQYAEKTQKSFDRLQS